MTPRTSAIERVVEPRSFNFLIVIRDSRSSFGAIPRCSARARHDPNQGMRIRNTGCRLSSILGRRPTPARSCLSTGADHGPTGRVPFAGDCAPQPGPVRRSQPVRVGIHAGRSRERTNALRPCQKTPVRRAARWLAAVLPPRGLSTAQPTHRSGPVEESLTTMGAVTRSLKPLCERGSARCRPSPATARLARSLVYGQFSREGARLST